MPPNNKKIISHTCVMIFYRLHIEIQHRNALTSFNFPVHIENVFAGRAAAELLILTITLKRRNGVESVQDKTLVSD